MTKKRYTISKSSSGKKTSAVQDSKGRFLDVQTYKRVRKIVERKRSNKGRHGSDDTGPRKH